VYKTKRYLIVLRLGKAVIVDGFSLDGGDLRCGAQGAWWLGFREARYFPR